MRAQVMKRAGAGLLVGLLVLAGACSDDDGEQGDDAASDDVAAVEEQPAEDDGDSSDDGADTSGEVDCSPEGLGEDAEFDFTTANEVDDGELGPVCLGDDDAVLDEAWDLLASIVPEDDLANLALFAGFEGGDEGDEVTLAFVNRIPGTDTFQMSVNLPEADADRDVLVLTMVHEFGHVLTQLPDQLDLDVAPEDCTTFYNGDGCFVEGSIMDEWIQAFWSPADLEAVDPFDASAVDGEERCTLDDGFFGAYAASTPEEDFAEALSAYVLEVPAETDGQQERYDLLDQYQELYDQQLNAVDAGLTPLPNTFDTCG